MANSPCLLGCDPSKQSITKTLSGRELALNTGLYAFTEHTQGSAYWTAGFFSDTAVDGQGTQEGYWNYMSWIDRGTINPDDAKDVCS